MSTSDQQPVVPIAPQKPVVNYIRRFLRLPESRYVDFETTASTLEEIIDKTPERHIRTFYSDRIVWEIAMNIDNDSYGEKELGWNNWEIDRLVRLLVELIQSIRRNQSSHREQVVKNAIMLGVLNAHNKIIWMPDRVAECETWRAQLHLDCHAFASRLFYEDILTDDMLMVQAMREAFEVKNPEANIHLTLVAVYSWLSRCHDELVCRITTRQTTERGDSARYSTGELYHKLGGRPRLDKTRWDFWKWRFLLLTEEHYGETHPLSESAENMHQFGVPIPGMATGP